MSRIHFSTLFVCSTVVWPSSKVASVNALLVSRPEILDFDEGYALHFLFLVSENVLLECFLSGPERVTVLFIAFLILLFFEQPSH